MRSEFWLNDEAWAAIEPLLPEQPAWSKTRRRSRRDQRDRSLPEVRLPLEGLPGQLRPTYDHLQPLQSMEPSRDLGPHLCSLGVQHPRARRACNRLDLCQSPSLGGWRERRAAAQAIGPSRGGRTTKIHVLTDTKG